MRTLLVLLVFHATLVAASSLRIEVRNAVTNRPVAGAKVRVIPRGPTLFTDEKGVVLLEIEVGKVRYIEVSKENALNEYVRQNLLFREETIVVQLTPITAFKDEIVVTGTRTPRKLSDSPVRTEVVTRKEIDQAHATTLYDIVDKTMLGMQVQESCVNCNFSQLRMQGLDGNYSAILIDGEPIFSGLAGVYGIQQIMADEIERVEIIKGAGSALYGSSAIGGVLNIITRNPTFDPQFASHITLGDYGTREEGLSFSQRRGNVAGSIILEKRDSDYTDVDHDDFSDKVEQDLFNLQTKGIFFMNDDRDQLHLFSRYVNEFRRGGFIPTLDDQMAEDSEHITTDRYEYGASYKHFSDGGDTFNLTVIDTLHERWATNGSRPFRSSETIFLVDSQGSWKVGRHRITLGATYKDEVLDQVINRKISPTLTSITHGLYAQDELCLDERTDLVLGLRYDRVKSTLIRDDTLNPRIGIKRTMGKHTTLRLNVGTGFRVPYLFSEDLHLCSAAPLIYNPGNLKPEKSLSYTFDVEVSPSLFTYIDLTLFHTTISDKIYFTEDGAPEGFDFTYKNGGDATTQGVEIIARFVLSNWRIDTGINLTDARYDRVEDYGVNEKSRKIMRTPELSANLKLTSPEVRGWEASIQGKFTGHQSIVNYVEDDVDTTPSYMVWNLKVTKNIISPPLSIFIGVDNLFDLIQSKKYNPWQDESAAYIYAPLTGRYIYGGMKITF